MFIRINRFTKCWEIKNNGRIPWPPGCTLQYNGGDFISVFTSLPTTTLEPGGTMTLSTDFVTPSKPGSYQSKWRMMLPSGTYFGGNIFVVPFQFIFSLSETMTQFYVTPLKPVNY